VPFFPLNLGTSERAVMLAGTLAGGGQQAAQPLEAALEEGDSCLVHGQRFGDGLY